MTVSALRDPFVDVSLINVSTGDRVLGEDDQFDFSINDVFQDVKIQVSARNLISVNMTISVPVDIGLRLLEQGVFWASGMDENADPKEFQFELGYLNDPSPELVDGSDILNQRREGGIPNRIPSKSLFVTPLISPPGVSFANDFIEFSFDLRSVGGSTASSYGGEIKVRKSEETTKEIIERIANRHNFEVNYIPNESDIDGLNKKITVSSEDPRQKESEDETDIQTIQVEADLDFLRKIIGTLDSDVVWFTTHVDENTVQLNIANQKTVRNNKPHMTIFYRNLPESVPKSKSLFGQLRSVLGMFGLDSLFRFNPMDDMPDENQFVATSMDLDIKQSAVGELASINAKSENLFRKETKTQRMSSDNQDSSSKKETGERFDRHERVEQFGDLVEKIGISGPNVARRSIKEYLEKKSGTGNPEDFKPAEKGGEVDGANTVEGNFAGSEKYKQMMRRLDAVRAVKIKSCEIPLAPGVIPGMRSFVWGIGPFNGGFLITQVEHTVDSNGGWTSLTMVKDRLGTETNQDE